MTDGIIVIGASGRVGRMVAAALQADEGPASRIILQNRRNDAATNARSLLWDPMTGADALCDWVAQQGALRAMVVLAGVTSGGGQDLSLNIDIATACVNAAAAARIPRVLVASSSAVYGAGDGTPFAETTLCQPVNAYGTAKLAMERACNALAAPGFEICCLRIGNVAGADALLLNVAKSAPDQAIEIDIFDDGRGPVRSYIGARTLASVLRSLCLHPDQLPAVVNIGTLEPVSMDALADAAHHRWLKRSPTGPTPQSITLDCSLLSTLHEFNTLDSRPDEMVRQWKETLNS